jgi:hypothetical protein
LDEESSPFLLYLNCTCARCCSGSSMSGKSAAARC